MLLAYIDEIGDTGAYVSRQHARFNTNPAFGYAGIVVPADKARVFGQRFNEVKRSLFKDEIAAAEHPGRWERKGSDIFRPNSDTTYAYQIRAFNGLVTQLRALGGALFYYADEKPLGTPGQTRLDPQARETAAMRETLNRIARHAHTQRSHIMVVIDQINEKTRAERLPNMYGHILGRAAEFEEMHRIIEPPMHVDSVLSSNIQFADWVAAFVSRAINYHLVEDSPYGWVTSRGRLLPSVHGAFTLESKLHLWHRSIGDFNNTDIVRSARPLYPVTEGVRIGATLDPAIARRLKAAAEQARRGR